MCEYFVNAARRKDQKYWQATLHRCRGLHATQRKSLLLFSLAQLLLRRILDNEGVQLVAHIHI